MAVIKKIDSLIINEYFHKRKLIENHMIYLKQIVFLIGVSHFKFGNKRRSLKFNPILILTILLIYFFKNSISLLIVNNEEYSIYLGDFAYYWNCKQAFNILMIVTSFQILTQLLLHYVYYKYIKDDYWLKINDKNINVWNEFDFKSKMFYNLLKFNNYYLVPISGFFLSFIPLALNISMNKLLIFGIFWSIILTLFAFYACNCELYPVIYFFLIAIHYKNEFQFLNYKLNYLLTLQSKRGLENNIRIIFIEYNRKHKQFLKSNDFWSKYIFIIWFGTGCIIAILFFQSIYGKLDLWTDIIFGFISLFTLILLLCFCFFSSIVYKETEKTFGILNLLMKRFIEENVSLIFKFKV